MGDRPTGTVTFLFTDVQGSTRLWEDHPLAMRDALARHDELLRNEIERHGGYIVKGRGDGFHAAFASARQAVDAAIAAQLALEAEHWNETGPIRARMALHTGTAEERAGDYFGPAVNRAARLLDAAHGGQVLVSHTTAELLCDDLPAGTELRDLGEHRLKDLTNPDRLYQVVAPGLPDAFPPPRTLTVRPNNLPAQATTFIGRGPQIGEVKRLLERARLVTLLGPGGVGKTRLALHVAAQQLDAYPDGVWFTDLAPITDPSLVLHRVASVLSVREQRGEPLETTLLLALREKHLLLLLDNCEHLIDACATLAGSILRTCPRVQILATSREPLRIAEEVRCRVPPLAVPEQRRDRKQSQYEQYSAVRLFVDRAAAISPRFTLTPENGPAIAEIVRQLDGIPLAIELAAAHVSALTPAQIAQRLDDRFRLLRRGSRNALPRQQTLSALIDWSYGLLSVAEQQLFQRLSVFAGGFTLEAAEAVCSGDPVDPIDVLDLLTQLIEKSLVMVNDSGPTRRYWLLETLREYACRHMKAGGDDEQLRRRHAHYFLALAEEAEPRLSTDDQSEWFARLRVELDNFRVALEWSRTNELETGLRLASALWRVWWVESYVAEGRSQLERLWEGPIESVPLAVRLDALHARGYLAFRDGDSAAARAHFEAMHELAERTGARKHVLLALRALGGMLVEQLDYDGAATALRESLRLEGEQDELPPSALARVDYGLVSLGRAQYDEAERLFEESLAISKRDGDFIRIAVAEFCLGLVALAQGRSAAARARLESSLRLSREQQFRWAIPLILEGFAALAAQAQQPARAIRLATAAAALREVTAAQFAPLWQQLLEPPIEAARRQIDAESLAAAIAAGEAMTAEQAVAYALEAVVPDEAPSLNTWTSAYVADADG